MNQRTPILIVDDDEILLEMLRSGLSTDDFRCAVAHTASSAIELLRATPFEVMVVDVVLPDLDGFELTRRAKILRPKMAVIIMTGYIDDFSYDRALEAGASDFIKKPFTFREMQARIKHVRMHEEVRSLLHKDELTDLYNRRGFFTLVEYLLKMAKRQKKCLFMLYADLDNLKYINDTWGHQEGDRALIAVAQILTKNFRESDIIARIGGDEFVVIPVGTAGDHVDSIFDRLYKAVEDYNSMNKRDYHISISAGMAFYDPENPSSIDELLAEGDKSMYEWKRRRKNS
ncbi:MAG: GGDEF domain-containing response regulator [Nitrospirota bacterium]